MSFTPPQKHTTIITICILTMYKTSKATKHAVKIHLLGILATSSLI